MSDAVAIELIKTLPTILGGIGSIAAAWFAFRASLHAQHAVVIAEKTEINTNSKMDLLLKTTAKAAHAEGKLEGQEVLRAD